MSTIRELFYIDSDHHISTKCRVCDRPLIYPVFCTRCEFYTCKWCLTSNSCCNTEIVFTEVPINGRGLLSQVLSEMQISCPVNYANGCKWIGVRAELTNHYETCIKSYHKCDFGCELKTMSDDISHLDLCEKFQSLEPDSDNRLTLMKNYYVDKVGHLQKQIDYLVSKTIVASERLFHNLSQYYQSDPTVNNRKNRHDTCNRITTKYRGVVFSYTVQHVETKRHQHYPQLRVPVIALTLPAYTANWIISATVSKKLNFERGIARGHKLISPCHHQSSCQCPAVLSIGTEPDYEIITYLHHTDAELDPDESNRTFHLRQTYIIDDDHYLTKLKSGNICDEINIGLAKIVATRID